jgi:hypothetical protein
MSFWKSVARGLTGVATGGLSEGFNNDSIKNALFGEGPSVSSFNNLSSEQQALLNMLMKAGGSTIETGIPAYSGEMYAPTGDINTTLFSKVKDLLASGGTNSGTIQDLVTKYMSNPNVETFDPANVTELFNKTVKAPALQSFNEDILPAISEKLAGRNAFQSGATVYEMNKAGSDLASDLSSQLATMMETERTNVANRNLTTNQTNISSILSLLGLDEQSINNLLSQAGTVGTTQQTLNQQPYTEAYTKWSTSQPYNNPWLQYMMQALGVNTTTPVVNPGNTGILQSFLQGAGQALGKKMT